MSDETSKTSGRDIDVMSAEHSAVAAAGEKAQKPVVMAPEGLFSCNYFFSFGSVPLASIR